MTSIRSMKICCTSILDRPVLIVLLVENVVGLYAALKPCGRVRKIRNIVTPGI